MLANAAACLAELGRDEANRAPIAADGAARPLAALLERSTDPRVLGNAAGALANLAALPANRAALVEQVSTQAAGFVPFNFLHAHHPRCSFCHRALGDHWWSCALVQMRLA